MSDPKTPLVVHELRVENFKRIEAVTITPDGAQVLLNGDNDQGKSSTLEAMLAALLGKIAFPKEPVRRGAKKASVRVELKDASGKIQLTVERVIRPDGAHALKLTSPDPNCGQDQATLNRMLGQVAFDPFEFAELPAKEQAARLREACGIDTSAIESDRASAYAQRTEVGREVQRLEALVASGNVGAATGERQDTAGMLDDLAALNEQVKALNDRIRAAEAHNRTLDQSAQQRATHDANRRALDAATARRESLTETIEGCDQDKAQTLAGAVMPVPGLTLEDDVVLFEGIPLAQAGDGTRLEVATALGFALNPTIRIALIRQGSLLDEKSLAAVARMAAEHGGQVWCEKVAHNAPVGFLIEDGRVAAINGVRT